MIDPKLLPALSTVLDPELRRPLTELGMIESASLEGGLARVRVLLTVEGCPLRSTIEQDLRSALADVPGLEDLELDIDYMSPEQRVKLRETLGHTRRNPFADENSLTKVFAVVSGKGGVGKSSMTANLAAAAASMGLSVGIVDADIHGFSIPGLLGISQGPTRMDEMILPPVVEAPVGPGFIKVISIGMFVGSDQPVAWRGPMLHRALEQFLTDVHFGALDVLFLDLPPGTGDIAISMAQILPTARLVLVSTPQAAAVEVAQRAGTLSLQTGQKVVGVVENMAAMRLPDGSLLEMFGSGGGQQLSESLSTALGYPVPLLGSVPLDVSIRTGGDAGKPLVWAQPQAEAAQVISSVAQQLLQTGELAGKRLPLNIL